MLLLLLINQSDSTGTRSIEEEQLLFGGAIKQTSSYTNQQAVAHPQGVSLISINQNVLYFYLDTPKTNKLLLVELILMGRDYYRITEDALGDDYPAWKSAKGSDIDQILSI